MIADFQVNNLLTLPIDANFGNRSMTTLSFEVKVIPNSIINKTVRVNIVNNAGDVCRIILSLKLTEIFYGNSSSTSAKTAHTTLDYYLI